MKSKKGFTLIELLIVIAIIAVLAVAFLPQVLGAPSKGRDAQRLAQMQKLQQFLTAESVSGSKDYAELTTACIASDVTTDKSISKFVTANLPDFGGVFPTDPKSDNASTGAIDACAGKYGFIKFTDATAKKSYAGAVYTAMENKESANIRCEDVKDNVTATVLKKGADVTAATGTNGYCYIALIQ